MLLLLLLLYQLIYSSAQLPELVLLTVPNIREYFDTKIRFSTPACVGMHVGLRVLCAYCKKNAGSI